MEEYQTRICSNEGIILLLDTLIGLVLYSILMLISAILPWVQLCCKNIEPIKTISNFWTENFVERVFDSVLKRHRSKEGEDAYFVSNYKAPPIYTNILSFLLIQMVAVAAVQFCDDFFIEESHGCITHGLTCCYSSYSGLLDCSNQSYLDDNNITNVICYRLVFHLGTATANALGVVTTTALIIYIITLLLLKVSNGTRATQCRKCCTVAIQIITILLTACLTVAFCYFQLRSHSLITKTLNAVSEITPTGVIIILYTILFPWCKFKNDNPDSEMYEPLSE